MSKKQSSGLRANQKGFTLIEVMIAAAVSSVVFAIMMGLLGKSADFSGYFHSTANSIEATSDAISQLNAVMAQVVRVRSCGCRGTPSTTLTNCVWEDSSAANSWYDPIQSGGASNAATYGIEIFRGDYESYYGGDNTAGNGTSGGTVQLATANLPAAFGATLGGCQSYTALGAGNVKGCKLQVSLYYKAPVIESGSTAALAGMLRIELGTGSGLQVGGGSNTGGILNIGGNDRFGGTSTSQRGAGISVSRLSCGFVKSTGQTSGMIFALNMKIKTRSTTLQDTSNPNYESWYPTGKNYNRGIERELRFKYSFRNLNTRGVYQWRPQARRGCTPNGTAPASGTKNDCCSLALSGGVCVQCLGAGAAGTINSCCSETVSGGTCK